MKCNSPKSTYKAKQNWMQLNKLNLTKLTRTELHQAEPNQNNLNLTRIKLSQNMTNSIRLTKKYKTQLSWTERH